MATDSLSQSLVKGRMGALALLGLSMFLKSQFGMEFTGEDMAQMNQIAGNAAAVVSGIMIFVSKYREIKREREKKLATVEQAVDAVRQGTADEKGSTIETIND